MASKASSSSSRGTNRRVQVDNVEGEPSATTKADRKISRLGEHDLSQICKSINAGHAGGIIRCVVEYLLEISV